MGEFLAIAREHAAEIKEVHLRGHMGPELIRYCVLENPKKSVVTIPVMPDDEVLTPTVLSSLCRNLRIDPARFGLTLD